MADRSHWKLWTIQSRGFAARIARAGEVHGPSARYVQSSWRPAYRFMRDYMRRCGILNSLRFPIWAWHSCGGWQQAPNADHVRFYLSEDQIARGYMMIALRVPKRLTVLSDYGMWCDFLDSIITCGEGARRQKTGLPKGLFDTTLKHCRNDWGHDPQRDIQACLPVVNSSWVRGVAPITPTGDIGEWSAM